MYDFRRKRVIKFLRADSHSVDEVADYVVRKLGYTEVSPSDETYQTEYSNMRASFLLQYRPELLGDLTEPQRPQQWDEKSVMEFMKQIEQRIIFAPVHTEKKLASGAIIGVDTNYDGR